MVRQAAPTVVLGEESAEMLSDDLVGCITLEALGAAVPIGTTPFGSRM